MLRKKRNLVGVLFMTLLTVSLSIGAFEFSGSWTEWKRLDGAWCLRTSHKSTCLPLDYIAVEISGEIVVFHPTIEHAWQRVIEFHANLSDKDEAEYFSEDVFTRILSDRMVNAKLVKYQQPGSNSNHPDIFAYVLRFEDGFTFTLVGSDDRAMLDIVESLSAQWASTTEK